MDERDSGPYSGASPMDYDAELRLLNDVLRRAYGIERHDQVLDIGCGAGQTTREAARIAAEGGALGVDLSEEAIGRARELAQAGGVRNATFVHADAQVHPFPSERFDLAISRFGTMFFLDPVAAFANIGRALRPAGRLVTMVWQGHERTNGPWRSRKPWEPRATSQPRRHPIPSHWPIRRRLRGSWMWRVSRTSPSPTSTSPSTTVGTSRPRSSGSAASRARRRCWRVWAPHRRSGRSGASERSSQRMRAGTASGSTRGLGS